ncbi:hypothetical protein FACS1894216_07410 [Synergistales bacterium]|nr:hypothetical protein FACS1894216_07410 [Synergistales bacterium]
MEAAICPVTAQFVFVKNNFKLVSLTLGNYFKRLNIALQSFMDKLGFGMRAKLIILFVIIKVIPLIIMALMAMNQATILGEELSKRSRELAANANAALANTGELAVKNSVKALDDRATESIERLTTDTARDIANFLYERDRDILELAEIPPTEQNLRDFLDHRTGRIVKPGKWKLADDGASWVLTDNPPPQNEVKSSNSENGLAFKYRPPDVFEYEDRPTYLEATFIDTNGNETVKVVTNNKQMNSSLGNVSNRRNTYVRAETYFQELKALRPGEIYVSDVIGAYVGSRYIGMYTPANAEKAGIAFSPEDEAYSGRENPLGKRFKGIVRWASPVTRGGRVVGYVTLALDHDHIMEFVDHITPTDERYVNTPSAYEGNYAFIWDYQCRNIAHPRHHSIVGYNPETGEPEVPWLEESIYKEWQESGKPYTEFIKTYPAFKDQSRSKKPAIELTKAGLVGLDGRYLNNAPQCTGWYDLTSEGGSGSFTILWSGVTKLTTAAAIPYYTGQYGKSKRGFAMVTIGAGLDDFQRPAKETEKSLNAIIAKVNEELANDVNNARRAIRENLADTTYQLVISALLMIVLVVFIAIWLAGAFTNSITDMIKGISRFRSGERQFRFNRPIKDELGLLADSFDDMADGLVASVTYPIAITDKDLKLVYLNEQALARYGCNLEDIVGHRYYEKSIYPENSPYDPVKALMEDREADILHIHDTDDYLRGSANYVLDKAGNKIGYIIRSIDVTDIIKQQREREEQRALLNTVFAASPDLIWYKDTEGRYLAVNPRFASISGRTEAGIVGLTANDVMKPEEARVFQKNDDEAMALSEASYQEEAVSFADGHNEILDTVRTPIFGRGGNLMGMLGFARDVSERVAMQNDLREAVIAANNANMAKGDFLARMSHELRTPMHAIMGMANIVKQRLSALPMDVSTLMSSVSQIETSSQHLLGLINDILDISNIDAGKIELERDKVDLPKLVSTVESIIRPRCEDKKMTFDISTEGCPRSVITDPLRVRQVLLNLLGNAVKFTNPGGRVGLVVKKEDEDDGKALIRFSVTDTGIGIDEKDIPGLFRAFEQVDGKLARKQGGSGVGLSISRNIVNLLGGDISVQSQKGKGSVFSFEIWTEECADDAANGEAPDATGKFEGLKAMIVDDVDINRMILGELLDFTGIESVEAEDGEQAVKLFSESPEGTYDIIFMDIQMPGMNGYEAAAAIRSMERADAGAVPIVALTANAFKDDMDKSFEVGMNSHLAKPIELPQVIEVMFKFLKGK